MAEDHSPQNIDSAGTESKEESDGTNLSSQVVPDYTEKPSDNLNAAANEAEADEIPTEVLEALPPEMRKKVSASFTAMVHSSSSRQSQLAKNIKPEHISKILINSDNDSKRDFDLKRLAMGAILLLVAMILTYAAITKDKDLSEKILVASIAAVGGAGVGYGVGRNSRDWAQNRYQSLLLTMRTLAITWPQRARKINKQHSGAAQVYGIVSRFRANITGHLVEGRCASRFETTSLGQSPRHHGMQRHSPDSLYVQGSYEILTDV